MNIAVSLPTGDGFGWGVCGDRLRREFHSFRERPESARDGTPMVFTAPMLHAIQGTNMLPLSLTEWSSSRNIGLCFIEESELVKRFIPNARRYFDQICAGSTWNAHVLRDAGLNNVSVAIQGVDTDYFVPGEASRADRFVIFSGGKMEWRKGTDIAMKAIGVMMQRHADVYAVAAWHNQWPHSLNTMQASQLIKWDGSMDHAIDEAGIDRARLSGPVGDSVKHLDTLPLYQQCDIGLFPNRVEGGTNMVMCEFMACGKPVISMRQHGHADVIRRYGPFTLRFGDERITAVMGANSQVIPVAKYWEVGLEEVLAVLEAAYNRRDSLTDDGSRNRETVKQFTWSRCASTLLDACRS